MKQGVKYDTVADFRNSPLHMTSLFPHSVISTAGEEIGHHNDKRYSGGSHKKFVNSALVSTNKVKGRPFGYSQ